MATTLVCLCAKWFGIGQKISVKRERATDKVFFCADKIFTMGAVVNYQNDRTHYMRQKPARVMVCTAVSSDVSKSTLVFNVGLNINSSVNQQMMVGNLLLWLSDTFRQRYVFIQSDDSAQEDSLTKNWRNLSGSFDMSSSEIKDMDFAMYIHIEADVSRSPYTNISDRK